MLRYRTGGNRVIFGGDSHDDSWEHILKRHDVKDIDLLIAPHHGRDSGRSYEFLDVLKPTLTFFGNAPSEHLAYDRWRSRGLRYITNNQGGTLIADGNARPMTLYVTHKRFAEALNPHTYYSDVFKAWYCGPIDSV